MLSYRITKFDPQKRDRHGAYQDNTEWTSMSDIGKPAYRSVTFADYEQVETAYVNAIKSVMIGQDIDFLKIEDLESYFITSEKKCKQYRLAGGFEKMQVDYTFDFKCIKDGMQVAGEQLEKMIRLVLREHLHMLLVGDKIEVRFGYDYYMYIKCARLKPHIIKQIEATGLFVESDIEQYKFIIIGNNNEN